MHRSMLGDLFHVLECSPVQLVLYVWLLGQVGSTMSTNLLDIIC